MRLMMTFEPNKRIAEEAFFKFSQAVKLGNITLQKCNKYADLYGFSDNPDSKPRFTYGILSPNDPKQVIAAVVIVLSGMHEDRKTTWNMTWAVDEKYRNKGLGKYIASIALDEFVSNVKNRLGDFAVEATVDQGHTYSLKIGQTILGGEEIVTNPDGSKVHSYWKAF